MVQLIGKSKKNQANPTQWKSVGVQQPSSKYVYQYLYISINTQCTYSCWLIHTCSMYMDVSENSDTPKSSILIGFSIINHPFGDTTIFGNTYIYIYLGACLQGCELCQLAVGNTFDSASWLEQASGHQWVSFDMSALKKKDQFGVGFIGDLHLPWLFVNDLYGKLGVAKGRNPEELVGTTGADEWIIFCCDRTWRYMTSILSAAMVDVPTKIQKTSENKLGYPPEVQHSPWKMMVGRLHIFRG